MAAFFASIEWPLVSALAACAGVMVTMFFHIKNLAKTWLSNSAKMVLELSAVLNTEEMRQHRARFARQLLTDRSAVNLHHDNPVLGFLEDIGYMTKRGILDKGMVWNSFYWMLDRYYN